MRQNNMVRKVRSAALDLLCMVVGSIIYAVGVNGFTAPNNIAPGGVTGIATMLNYLFDTPIGIVIFLINIPIILWAIVEIGYKLVAKTMLAIICNSVAIDVVALFMPVYHGDPLIITLIGGVCEGVGLSLVFMRGATTGGTDMIARLLNHRLRHRERCLCLHRDFCFDQNHRRDPLRYGRGQRQDVLHPVQKE